MPNTPVQAAGEAMPIENTLEAMIDRYLAAKAAMDAGEAPEGSEQEAEFHAALAALQETDAKPSSFEGAMKALRLAVGEVADFDAPEMVPNLLRGILSVMDARDKEHPWVKARRVSKELSAVLGECDNADWFAHVMPDKPMNFNGFGAYPMRFEPDDNIVDTVNALAWQLADALNTYADGKFHARVYPSAQSGYAVAFAATKTVERLGQ